MVNYGLNIHLKWR